MREMTLRERLVEWLVKLAQGICQHNAVMYEENFGGTRCGQCNSYKVPQMTHCQPVDKEVKQVEQSTYDITFDVPSGDREQGMWVAWQVLRGQGPYATENNAQAECNRRNKELGWTGD